MATSAGTAFVEVQPSFSSFQSKLTSYFGGTGVGSKMGKYGAIAGGAFAVGFAGKALFDIGKQFDDAFDTIRTKTGATGKELGKLEDQFKSVVSSVPTDFQTAADAVGGLNQRLDEGVKPMTQLAKQLVALSKITGEDVNTEVQTITRLFGDWSVKTKDQTETLDELFRLTQVTGIGMTDLSDLMVQFGSPLRQLGFHFDEAASMFARFEREGVNMQTLLPGLRFALKNISLPTADLSKQFKQLGIDTKDPHKALLQIFDVLSKDKISEADQTMLASGVFGGRAWADMKAAIEEGRFSFDDLISTMKGGDETIRGTERSTRDFSEQWILFKNRVMVWLEPLATTVFKNLGEGMKNLNALLHGHGGFAEGIQNASDSLHDFWENSAIFRAAVQAMGDTSKRILDAIEEHFQGFKNAIKGITEIISGILTLNFKRAWQGVKDTFHGALQGIIATMRLFTAPVREVASRIGEALKDPIGAALDWVKEAFHNATDAVRDALRAMSEVTHTVARAIAAPFRWLAGVVKKIMDFIRSAVNKAVGALGKIQDAIPDLGIDLPGLPSLPSPFAQGGLAAVVPGSAPGDKHLLSLGGVPIARVESREGIFVGNRRMTGALGQLNRLLPRRQGGGYAGMQPGIISLMQNVIRQFGGFMSSGYRPGDPGFHGRGMAGDWVGGDWAGASRYINSIGPSLLEGIHQAPPGSQVSWDSGHQVSPSFWGPSTWAAHVSHIHMAIAGAVSGAIKGMLGQIGKIDVKGKGPLAGVAQGAADRIRKAANQYLSRLAPATTDTAAISGVPTGPIQKMARQMVNQLWGPSQWSPFNLLEMSEAGWNPAAVNASSGAAGLAQALPPSKYPPGAWPYTGLNSAKLQLEWMMGYIRDRYGTPAGAWGFHQAHNWYGDGGRIGGPLGKPQAIVAHGGESVLPVGATIEVHLHGPGMDEMVDEVYGIVDGHTVEVMRQGGKNVSRARQLAGMAGRRP